MLVFLRCLKSGLDDLPAFDEANIENFTFEYRWLVKNGDYDQLRVYPMDVNSTVDEISNTVNCVITVPSATDTGANPKDDFPTEIRNQVSLSSLVGYANISTAATMSPIDNAPKLGEMGDYSVSPLMYKVVAADGTVKEWTLNITEFNK